MTLANLPTHNLNTGKYRIAALVFLLAFLGIRVGGLLNDPLLEDHDGTGYLSEIVTFSSLELDRISALKPESVPLYPLLAGLLAASGVSPELAARSVSLAASVLMAAFIVLVAARLGSWLAGAAAAMFIAFEPVMARLSYGVLTEPLYAALVAAGLWFMIRGIRSASTLGNAAGLGLIFGLSFLCRLEGILFLAMIPFIHWCVTLIPNPSNIRAQLKPLVAWTAVFAAVFVLLAAPQVWRVSKEMKQFSLNGREAWSVVLSAKTGQSEEARLRGLDYSPSVTNLDYLMRSPDELAGLSSSIDIKTRVKLVTKNLNELQRQSLPALLAPSTLIFVPIGFLYLLRIGKRTEAFILACFTAVAFAAPLMHNTIPRHILAAAPSLIALAALGLLGAGAELRQLAESARWKRWSVPALFAVMMLITIASTITPLERLVRGPDRANPSADPALYARFVPMLSRMCKSSTRERVIARQGYVNLYSGCRGLVMPYASLQQLRVYAELNGGTLVFIDSDRDALRPFYDELTQPTIPPDGFELLAKDEHLDGRRQFLYRLHYANTGADGAYGLADEP